MDKIVKLSKKFQEIFHTKRMFGAEGAQKIAAYKHHMVTSHPSDIAEWNQRVEEKKAAKKQWKA